MRHYSGQTTKEEKIVLVYFLLVVFLGVLVFIVKDNHEPGCEYRCDAKISATITRPNFVDFADVNGWKPDIYTGTQVYITYANSETSTCTVVYDGGDRSHTSVASKVPLHALSYNSMQLADVQKSHKCYYGIYKKAVSSTVVDILIGAISTFLIVSVIVFFVRRYR
ncbi:MAG: hypothetical protein J5752_07700 [Clostridiales bacterium]|nr:hypothetical protein [Clostridiales bacterium]